MLRSTKMPMRPVTTSGFTSVIQVGSTTVMSGGGPSMSPPIPNEPTLWASQPVAVGERDVSGVTVELRKGARIQGRVEFEGNSEKPTSDRLRQLFLNVESADGRSSGSITSIYLNRAQIDATGAITTYEFPAGKYLIRPVSLPGWTFKSAMFEGHDVSETPLELNDTDVTGLVLTFTDHPAELSGTVRDEKGQLDGTALVMLFPKNPAAWMNGGTTSRKLRSARTTTGGTFKISGPSPGDYYVVAIPEELALNWQDPKFLQSLIGSATTVSIADGEIRSLDVKTSRAR
jgi:hypothetical protein